MSDKFPGSRVPGSIEVGFEIDRSVSNEKSNLLDLGYLVLQLPQLHKLGLKAMQIIALIYQMTELIPHCAEGSEEYFSLITYCKNDGVRSIDAAHDVVLMMSFCVESIKDGCKEISIPSFDDVVEAVNETEIFISSLQQVVSSVLARVSDLPPTSDRSIYPIIQCHNPEALRKAARNAISFGKNSLKDLEYATVQFSSLRSSIFEWVRRATVTTHAGGHLQLYWPPN